MSRQKRNRSRSVFVWIKAIYERLKEYCEESGQPKTVAIERAISMYIDDYDGKKRMIKDR